MRPTPEQLISTSDTPIPVDVPQVPVNVAPYPEIKVEDSDLAPSHTPESQSASVRTSEPQKVSSRGRVIKAPKRLIENSDL